MKGVFRPFVHFLKIFPVKLVFDLKTGVKPENLGFPVILTGSTPPPQNAVTKLSTQQMKNML